jgi:hypothetical protein
MVQATKTPGKPPKPLNQFKTETFINEIKSLIEII